MIKVAFVTGNASVPGIYRGMDAYAGYLFPHLQKNTDYPDIRVEAVSAIRASEYDLYHFPAFSLYDPRIPLNLDKPFVITVHDVTRLEFSDRYPPGIKGRLKLGYQKLILHKAAAVITDSYSSVRQISRYLSIPPSKIKMIYLAAPGIFKQPESPAQLESIRRKYRLPDKFVLINGEIDWNKNLAGFLSACRKINGTPVIYGKSPRDLLDHPEKFDFSHPELSHLPHLRRQLMRPDVRVLGFIPDADLVGIFNLATAYCQPSFAEGFGIPVLQALACAVPVACSRTHSLPEIAGDAAVYFDPGNPGDISRALNRIIGDSPIRRELIKKGPAQAKKFSWNKTAAETIMVYRGIIKKL
jgi:glycosyltransferase involved in cell wall biosynthesis